MFIHFRAPNILLQNIDGLKEKFKLAYLKFK